MDQADLRRRHAQHLRDALAIRIDTLGVGPDRHDVIGGVSHRAGRADRPVRLVGPRIGGLNGLLPDNRGIAALEDGRILRRQTNQDARDIFLLRQTRGLLPFRGCRQRPHRLDRLEFLLGGDGQKIAAANDLDDAGHGFDRCRVALRQLRAIARRPHHTGMHHARQPHVLHIGRAARDLGRNIDARHRLAHHRVGRRILQLRLRLRLDVQHAACHQIAIAETLAIGRNHGAVFGAEIFSRHIETPRRFRDQKFAGLRCRIQDRGAAVLHGMAAGRIALIGGAAGIGGDDLSDLKGTSSSSAAIC